MSPEQLLIEAEDLLRTMPESASDPAWAGRCYAVLEHWANRKSILVGRPILEQISSAAAWQPLAWGDQKLVMLLHRAAHDLRMETGGPTAVVIPKGSTFHYFDEVRKIIEEAKLDLFFIDPYLDSEFVSRYLPYATKGVKLRLLARHKLNTLLPAVAAYACQYGAVEVRSSPDFHDRYMIVDGTSCYQSGASFKDGAKSSPTTLTEISDAFTAVHQTYENIWAAAKVE